MPSVTFGTFHYGYMAPGWLSARDQLLMCTLQAGWKVGTIEIYSALVSHNANQIWQECETDYLMFTSTDHKGYPPDLALRLSSHNKALCGTLYPRRSPPYDPQIWRYTESPTGKIEWRTLNPIPNDSLFSCDGVGNSFLLYDMRILRSILPPNPFRLLSDGADGEMGEDLSFAKRCYDLGISFYCDPTIPMIHTGFISLSCQGDKVAMISEEAR
jgi:hypothetical protein